MAGGSALSWLVPEKAHCLSFWSSTKISSPTSTPQVLTPPPPVGSVQEGNERMQRYELHEILGRGKFGVVRRGTLLATGEQVAVKLLPKTKKAADGARAAMREAELMRAVFHHPHIVNLRESFETDKHFVLVMDLASGGELFNRIVERGSYSEADASEVMRYVMSAVAHCHARGLAHRDLKPENLLLDTSDTEVDVRLCDFGLSARLEPGKETIAGKVGTVGYAAPETLVPNQEYGLRVDEWSVGVVLYILLGGYHPFDPDCAADDETITRRVKSGQWGFDDEHVWRHVSASAKELITLLLRTDPNERLSADEALQHPWLRGDSASNRPLPRSAERLGAFNEARHAWREATKAAINREGLTTACRRTALSGAFKMIDTNDDGQISRQELTVFLNKLEATATPAEIVENMLRNADVDGDGLISLDEARALPRDPCRKQRVGRGGVRWGMKGIVGWGGIAERRPLGLRGPTAQAAGSECRCAERAPPSHSPSQCDCGAAPPLRTAPFLIVVLLVQFIAMNL
jgi:calcium-dependent protein kinase